MREPAAAARGRLPTARRQLRKPVGPGPWRLPRLPPLGRERLCAVLGDQAISDVSQGAQGDRLGAPWEGSQAQWALEVGGHPGKPHLECFGTGEPDHGQPPVTPEAEKLRWQQEGGRMGASDLEGTRWLRGLPRKYGVAGEQRSQHPGPSLVPVPCESWAPG